MDPVPFFVMGLMVGSVGILLGQAFARRRISQGHRTALRRNFGE